MKEEEKKTIPWEMADPKPPVIQSGRMESRVRNTGMLRRAMRYASGQSSSAS